MKRFCFTFCLLLCIVLQTRAQGPESPTRGFLMTRVSSAERTDPVKFPSTTPRGTQVYDTDTKSFWYWDGTKWINEQITGSADTTNDHWKNDVGKVRLAYNANGAPRTAGTEFVIKDNGSVGVGTASPAPSSILDISSASKGVLFPRVALSGIADITTIANPSIGLLVFNTANAGEGSNRVYANNYYYWNGGKWTIFVAGTNLAKVSVPKTAIFELSSDVSNFLSGESIGGKQVISPLVTVYNGIEGLGFNESTSTMTLPAGVFQFNFVYEAAHNKSNCTISSYFVDFPSPDGVRVRIHSTASHKEGIGSNHGGAIVNASVFGVSSTSWVVMLGRGQSGNCEGSGMTLKAKSTQLIVTKFD